MKFIPHEYQKYTIEYIKQNPISAILLDMGLGKTVISLTAINDLMYDSFEVHKVLIIAPLRVARFSWGAEIRKWEHLKNLRYSIVVGTEKERRAALQQKADIYIINRENLPWLIENSKFDYDMVVVDELSSFKNHQAKRFKALMKVRPQVKRIVGLTGTPSSNGLMDLFAEFKLLDMGQRLGRFIGQYRSTYFQPDKMNGMIVYSHKPLPGAEERIYEKISDITISMKATDHLQMPELISSRYDVELSPTERQKYEQLKKDLVLPVDDEEITAANAAALSGKLCQLANGAIYDDDKKAIQIHDRKIDALEDIIESMNGRPLLVAYWFKHDYDRSAERLSELKIQYAKLDTADSIDRIVERLSELKVPFVKLDTDESIEKWNRGEIPVALIHPASAGHGLNLQNGGSTLVWFGITWSLELYQQTVARLWRQGQKNTVVIQHIITKNTIDENIMAALEKKEHTQSELIDAVKANI